MDSRSCNFTAAETNALLEGVWCHYGTIVGSFNSAKDTNKKKNDVWISIKENVNAIGSGQRRTTDQIKLRWKNLKARATKDHAEAKNPQTGNKPFKRGDYTDVVLNIIGALFMRNKLDPHWLSHAVVVATGSQRKGFKRPSSNKDYDYKALLQKETERAEAQLCLAEEQMTLTKLQQNKARLEIRILKATLRQAGLSTSDEEV
ncbi:hypothetical protein DPEC_G00237310 [Dallia pectoralis]|uniref:Uncharacterized protein n=1 Tax=Dallia pectoralis TaxID=75939 RepID=A0ACC2FYK4_DALPE|nr:hypothetical protein DPEC_G00237310 [Dallia pectoralis]